MRRIELALCAALWALPASAQVVAPAEIREASLRDLQQKHLGELKALAAAVKEHPFPYSFYFSRVLDLNEKDQESRDQRSIQFARNANRTVIQITGNYYASYSVELMPKEERAHRTFQDVILPILQLEVSQFSADRGVEGFAFEISHHIRKKALGVSSENAENVVLIIDKPDAVRLVAASGPDEQKEALLHASLFVNGKPASFWPGEIMGVAGPSAPADKPSPTPVQQAPVASQPTPAMAPPPVAAPVVPARDDSPDALKSLQTAQQPALDKLAHDLDGAAHFVAYAPPLFIAFHKGIYLQLSLTTSLALSDAGSRYKAATLAFDEHIARLIRPALAYFKSEGRFDGIDFSTTVRAGGQTEGGIAVEYIFNFQPLRCYEEYDCTGQQLINSGYVLINGERVSLDLQNAEAGAAKYTYGTRLAGLSLSHQ